MPFNKTVARKITHDSKGNPRPCAMCGRTFPTPHAAHIIDGKEWKSEKVNDSQDNGLPLCPSCHTVFDDYLRPRLFTALEKYGCKGLPKKWQRSNKKFLNENEANLGKEAIILAIKDR